MTFGDSCNCGNCPKYSTKVHPLGAQDIHFCNGGRISKYTPDTTKHTGCMLHPRTREAVMADVIKEIEANLNPQDRYWKGLMRALDLIRGGKE